MDSYKRRFLSGDLFHIGFELGLAVKGIDGLLEVVGGFLLRFLSPARMNRLIVLLTQHELSEDPKDLVANALIRFGRSFSISTQQFGMFYLVSHGAVKVFLVFLLWKRKLWAYPLTILSLILFIVYQIYRFALQPSAGLVLLTLFDLAMIALTFREYRRVKAAS